MKKGIPNFIGLRYYNLEAGKEYYLEQEPYGLVVYNEDGSSVVVSADSFDDILPLDEEEELKFRLLLANKDEELSVAFG